jgi:hypothetical protein
VLLDPTRDFALLFESRESTVAVKGGQVIAILNWGNVPDYFILASVSFGVISLLLQRKTDREKGQEERKTDREKGQEERNRQAQLEDLRIGWHAVAPLHAFPQGLDDNDLAQPFARALRQLQLTGCETLLEEVDKVINTLGTQTAARQSNSVDLRPLLEAIRAEYRRLMAVKPTSRPFLPLHIMSTERAGELGFGRLAKPPELGEPDSSP